MEPTTLGFARQQSRDTRLCCFDAGNSDWGRFAEQSSLKQRLAGLVQFPHLCSSRISPHFSLNLSKALTTALVSSGNRSLEMHGANNARLCPATGSRYSAVLLRRWEFGLGNICCALLAQAAFGRPRPVPASVQQQDKPTFLAEPLKGIDDSAGQQRQPESGDAWSQQHSALPGNNRVAIFG